MTAQHAFESLADTLAPVAKPAGLYKPCLIVGNQVLISGHLPLQPDSSLITGKVGRDLTAEEGKAAARRAGLASLVTLANELGSLDRIGRVVKLLGMVNAADDFDQHPAVINGCSELYAEVWGADRGVGTRSAVGVASLPTGVAVEIEAVFELS